MEVPQKNIKIELPYDLENSTPGCISEENKSTHSKRYMHPNVIALFIIVEIRKQPKYPSTYEWIKKIWYIYTQWNITQP